MPMHEGSGFADEFVIEVEVNGEVIGELTPIAVHHFHFDELVEESDESNDSEEQTVGMFIVHDDGNIQQVDSPTGGFAKLTPDMEKRIIEFIRRITGD